MDEMQQTVSTPKEATKLANGLAKLYLDILAAQKAGASGTSLITSAITAAVSDMGDAISGMGDLGSEASDSPVGVAEAFAIAGFTVARALTSK